MTNSIVLASASQGRQELMRRAGISFHVDISNCSETTEARQPEEHVTTLALRKATDVSSRHPDAIVIGADTVIICDGEILGKPDSARHAEAMLGRLAGRHHMLITGIAILHASANRRYSGVEYTKVHMRPLTTMQIRAYVASGEPMGKSGSYDIQGLGSTIIDELQGDFTNVVGLPMAHLARELESFGVCVP